MEKVEVEVQGTIKHESTNPVTIEVTRGQKGSYGWSIKVAGTDPATITAQIKNADAELQKDYPQPETG